MDEVSGVSIILLLCVLIGVGFFVWYMQSTTSQKSETPTKTKKKTREGFELGDEFYIYNYLNHPIQIDVISPEGKVLSESENSDENPKVEDLSPRKLLSKLKARQRKGFKLKEMISHLLVGNKLEVSVITKSGEKKVFGTYRMNVPENTAIKMLHIGMITSRWVGADSDYNIGKPGLNAVQGMPWIKIHNMTDYPLAINNNINISPGGTLRYTGRDHFGVRLGTVFKDQDGIFPDFIFTIPATDVYYGITSDIQQSLFGGFQLTPEFHADSDEPQFLLENGWMGGPATPKIPAGFLPIEGPEVPPQNRWGESATAENLQHPVGPPLELHTY